MSFSISHDWSKYDENIRNHGRDAIQEACTHYDTTEQKENGDTNMRYQDYCETCGHSEDSATPMMNFLYPLEISDFDNEKILQVVNRTNCTVIENEETGEWFLTLCGGGMDLSQDIALAYHILENWIPYELCTKVCKQKEFSVSGKDWRILRRAMIKSLELYHRHTAGYLQEWKATKANNTKVKV